MRGRRSRYELPTPVGDEVRRELARHGAQAGMAELVERWPDAVGPAVARFAWPARIGRDGTVHVNTADSVWAFELGHRAAEIAARVGAPSVRFAPGPLPADEPLPQRREARSPTATERELATALAAPIEDENLRKSVEKAIALSLLQRSSDRSV